MKWPTVTVAEIAEVNPSPPPSLREHPYTPASFVPMADVSEEGKITSTETRPSGEVIKGHTFFMRGDVLVAKITPCMENGKAAIADIPTEYGFGSTEFHVLSPGPRVDVRYLFHAIWTPLFRSTAARNMTGTAGQQRVPTSFMKRYQLPLPPLPEQKRIAAILDKADAIRRKRKESIRLADDFLRSVFLDMFGDPVTNPRKWPRRPLGELLDRIDSGWSPQCLGRTAEPGEWSVLKLSAVTSCVFLDDENKVLPSDEHPRPEHEVKRGDLLFSRKNTYALVAACALVGHTEGKRMLSDLIFRLCISNGAPLVPEYLWGLLTTDSKRRTVQALAGGSAGSMPNISKEKLRTVMVELPAMEKQQAYATLLQRVRENVSRTQVAGKDADMLFQSLSHRAFAGEP